MSDQIGRLLLGLNHHLSARTQEYRGSPPTIGHPEAMQHAVKALKSRMGEKQGKPPTDRIQEALTLLFRKGPEAALFSHQRYVCWGFLEPWGKTGRYVLAETTLFTKTLAQLKGLRIGTLSKSAWRGLLAAYFGWSPATQDSQNRRNWLELRRFLSDRLIPMGEQKDIFQPAWLRVLAEHANLLGEQPCERYGSALLGGDDSDLKPLHEELRIPKESWFWSELLLSQIAAATAQADEGFYRTLDTLLPRLSEFPFAIDAALRMLLDRYQQGGQRTSAHIHLRETAIAAWGSPHLERNARWGGVRPETKAMVRNWLVVKALEDFFQLLQEDRTGDERRLNFWLRYQRSIEYFYFALGPDADDNPQQDYRSFRKRFTDHICRLKSPGKRENNAFILKIQDYYIVEFGAVGNACYIYQKDNIPVQVGGAWLDLNDLKARRKAVFRLSHMAAWESEFVTRLGEIGIHPDNSSRRSASSSSFKSRLSAFDQVVITRSASLEVDPIISQAKLIAEEYGLEINDHRSSGGAFWVGLDQSSGIQADRLLRLGFRYHASRGWWKK